MAINRPVERRKRRRIPIEFPEIEDSASSTAMTFYKMLDVGDEAQLNYQGRSITINVDMLTETKILGIGNFGNVMLTEVQGCPGLKMAVKRLNLLPNRNNPDDYTAQTDLRTIRTVGSGSNSHVTTFYAALVDTERTQLLICMEVCETSMERFYVTMHRINETQHLDLLLRRMICHIVDALSFLKSKNILHRDVKPSNILINQNPITFKLCDFGICGQLVDSVACTMMKGTRIYLAPERIDRTLSPRGYGIRSDMWALGLSIHEIATNVHPFLGMESIAILNKVKTWIPELPTNLSVELRQLVLWLIKVDQAERPERYERVLSSLAIQLLPAEITDEEVEMVKKVFEQISHVPDNQI